MLAGWQGCTRCSCSGGGLGLGGAFQFQFQCTTKVCSRLPRIPQLLVVGCCILDRCSLGVKGKEAY